jgi:hypothetical protein
LFFVLAKGINAEDIHKEVLPLYVGKCLSRKAVHNCASNGFTDEEVETEVRNWLRQQSKDCYAVCFNGMGQVCQCWWRICREINVFQGSNVTCFTFHIHL